MQSSKSICEWGRIMMTKFSGWVLNSCGVYYLHVHLLLYSAVVVISVYVWVVMCDISLSFLTGDIPQFAFNFVRKIFVRNFRVPIIIFVHINMPHIIFAILYSSTRKKIQVKIFVICVRGNSFSREIFCKLRYVLPIAVCVQLCVRVHV